MNIIQGWKQAFMMLKPSNLRSFSADTITLFKQAYPIWLKSSWGLIIITFAYEYMSNFFYPLNGIALLAVGTAHFLNYRHLLFYMPLIYYILIVFLLESAYSACQQLSPSSMSRNYYKSALYLAIWLFVLGLLRLMITTGFSMTVSIPGWTPPFHPLIVALILTLIFIISMLAIWVSSLFIVLTLNSDGSPTSALRALFNAIQGIFYALPFCIVVGALVLALYVSMLFIFQVLIGGVTHIMSFMEFSQETIYRVYSMIMNYRPLSIMSIEIFIILPLLASMATIFHKKIRFNN
jgi:hypothetical protein